jgi:hypothetical protein
MLGVTVAAAGMAAVVAGSHAPLTGQAPRGALLRLAWSARPERIEDCRTQSAEDLARLPPHMRQAVVCEGVTARYRLVARHDGRIIVDRVVAAGGLRQDRRLYVLEEIPIAAGEALVEVRFERIDASSAPAGRGNAPAASVAERRGETVPPRLAFSERQHVEAHTVLLVSYDPARRELVRMKPDTTGPPSPP